MNCPQCAYDNFAGEEVCARCLHDLTQVDTTPTPKNEVHRSIIEDPVSKLKFAALATCGPEDQVAEAIESMKSKKVGCVVVEEKKRPIGIFTERDVLMKVVGKPVDPTRASIRSIMTAPVETVKSTDTLAQVLNKMSIGGYRHIPIVNADGSTSGVISVRNILHYLADQLA